MKVTAIIPARLSSERLPKKVLLNIHGLPMLMHVYNNIKSSNSIDRCVIATDSQEIEDALRPYDVDLIQTGICKSGTERVIKASKGLDAFDILINVQGDEPMITEDHIEKLIDVFRQNPEAQIATLVEKFRDESELRDPNNVKVVLSASSKALYFSRSVIPYSHSLEDYHFKHIGIYAFRSEILNQLEQLEPTDLRHQERLEQLDWLVAEIPIYARLVEGHLIGVDTEQDLAKVIHLMGKSH